MKKKSYKQLQNRLYREIKRRIEAENRIKLPIDVSVCERPIEKFGVIHRVPDERICAAEPGSFQEMIKKDMAHRIADDLVKYGYFVFSSANDGNGYTTLRAELNVVRSVDDLYF